MRYRLDKNQIKTLLNGKPLSAGKRKILVGGEVKEALKKIDSYNLYDKFEVIFDMTDGCFDINAKNL